MIRIQLDDATRDELRALRRTNLPPRVRDRIEMVTLSDAGWSPPRIAAHLGYHPQTVRDLLRAFLARGLAALYPFRSGPAPDLAAPGPGRRRPDRVARRGPHLDQPAAERGPRRPGHRPRPAADPPLPEAAQGRLPPHHHHPEAQAGPRQGRAGRAGPGQPAGQGRGRPAEALLPRRVRVRADAADGLQLEPAGRSGSGSSTRPRRAGGSTPWPPTAPTAARPGWRSSPPSGRGTRTTCWAS